MKKTEKRKKYPNPGQRNRQINITDPAKRNKKTKIFFRQRQIHVERDVVVKVHIKSFLFVYPNFIFRKLKEGN